MKLKKVLFLAGIFVGCININAQTVEQKKQSPQQQQAVSPKLKERAMKAKAVKTHAHAAKAENQVEEPQYAGLQGVTENDPYQGRTQEFLSMMVVDKLPSDFPKYEKGTGIKYYNDVTTNYFMQHLNLLKEQPRKKLSSQ